MEDQREDEGEADEHWVPELVETGSQQLPWRSNTANDNHTSNQKRVQQTDTRPLSIYTQNAKAKHRDSAARSIAEVSPLMSKLDYGNLSSSNSNPLGSEAAIATAPAPATLLAPLLQPMMDERTHLLEKLSPSSTNRVEFPLPRAGDSSTPANTALLPHHSPHMKSIKRRRLTSAARRRESHFHEGSSTSGQTLFNAINVLVGIGVLAMRESRFIIYTRLVAIASSVV